MSANTNPRAQKEQSPRSDLPRECGASVPLVSQPVDAPLSFKPIGALALDVLAKVRPQ